MNTNKLTSGKILFKNSSFNLIGMVLPLIVGIISIPFAVKGLGKEAFGILSIAWVILGYFGLFDFGLSRATTKFVSEMLGKNDIKSIPPIIWTSVIVSFILGVIGSVVLFMITPFLVNNILNIPGILIHQSKMTFYILSISIPFILCSTCFRGVLEASQRFDLVNIIVIPTSMLSFIIPSLSYLFNLSLPIIIFLIMITRLCALVIYLLFCFKIFPSLKERVSFNVSKFKKMLFYGGWVSITNIISPLLVYMDRFFIGSYLSMSSVAFYTVPYEMLVRLRIFPGAIMKTIFPEFSASSSFSTNNRLEKLFIVSIEYVLLVLGPSVALLFVYAPSILRIWMGAEFAQNSINVFRILSIGVFVNSIAMIPFNLLQGVGRPDLPAKFHFLEFFIYIALIWILIQRLGIVGVAYAWSLRVIIDAILLLVVTMRLYPQVLNSFNQKHSRTVKIGIWVLCLWILFYFSTVFFKSMFHNIIFLIVILLTAYVIVWKYFLNFSEKKIMNSILLKLSEYTHIVDISKKNN